MNEIISLVWLTHPFAISNAIDAYQDGTPIDDAAAEVIAALYVDDTFNEYSDAQLQAAISEILSEYNND